MQIKQVYVNDVVIGEAQTWTDVYELLGNKGAQFEGKPRAVEGPTKFFLHGVVVIGGAGAPQGKKATSATAPAEPAISSRAQAIAVGLVRTKRAAEGVQFDEDMMRLECSSGGYYWISLDGGQVLRGRELSEADELKSKFTDAMERAGR